MMRQVESMLPMKTDRCSPGRDLPEIIIDPLTEAYPIKQPHKSRQFDINETRPFQVLVVMNSLNLKAVIIMGDDPELMAFRELLDQMPAYEILSWMKLRIPGRVAGIG
jgi:hypothetical protein